MMTHVDILRTVAEDYVLGRSRAESLPMAAAEALGRGLDSPALRELAGLGHTEVREAGDLVRAAMAELVSPLRGPQEILWDQVRRVARNLTGRLVDPPDAAAELVGLLREVARLDGVHGHDEWLWQYDIHAVMWEEHPAHRDAIADEMRRTARDLLIWADAQLPPRRES